MVIQRGDYSSQSIALINQWRVNEPLGQYDSKTLQRETDAMRQQEHC